MGISSGLLIETFTPQTLTETAERDNKGKFIKGHKSLSSILPLDTKKIRKLYCESKISPPKIADIFSVDSNTIRNRLNGIGIKTKQFKGIHLSPDTEFKKGNHYSTETEWKPNDPRVKI